MLQKSNHTLITPETGNLAFKVTPFLDNKMFEKVQRLNYYTLLWIEVGNGETHVDLTNYSFSSDNLLAFSPHQPFSITAKDNLKGTIINFHPDFFCIHKHHKEVACDGVLFNNIYGTPLVKIDSSTSINLQNLVEQMKEGIQNTGMAQYELLVSYLKIFLITLSRLKSEQHPEVETIKNKEEPFVLQSLKNAIEAHFKEKHSASDYADILAITPKALAKITKKYYNKTITNLISDRIIIEAKRELYLTHKTVKEIAYNLGYDDEYYFSRFFKKNTNVSPQIYRETVGFNKASS